LERRVEKAQRKRGERKNSENQKREGVVGKIQYQTQKQGPKVKSKTRRKKVDAKKTGSGGGRRNLERQGGGHSQKKDNGPGDLNPIHHEAEAVLGGKRHSFGGKPGFDSVISLKGEGKKALEKKWQSREGERGFSTWLVPPDKGKQWKRNLDGGRQSRMHRSDGGKGRNREEKRYA